MKKYYIFFIFILFISLASSVTLTMGPQQLDFTSDSNCQSATIKAEGSEIVIGKILFSEEGFNERKLSLHNLEPEERKLKVDFPKEIIINNFTNIEICIDGPAGDYHGIILYKIKNKPVQVGIWLNATLSGNGVLSISKNVAEKIEEIEVNNLLGIMPIFWMIVLGGLVIVWRKKQPK